MKNILIYLALLFPFTIYSISCDSLLMQSIINPGPYIVNYIDESGSVDKRVIIK